ncbi:hypothetical protein PBCV1_a365L [Paramecium bursaria Chlorella virus 1]|uniref:Uncharacterized protein n=1 Tax=Paramecium bursaria Chlorella virus 1 TaxID=10506 RepID=Q84679_PBCV1|nr:hypothetical protein PBCV1_a365L [Paramecium bursaria Chlorella virus 1]AAC96733.1 hypothetical protein [Paramecium bursaria Chlorella virus 1]
MTCLTPKFYLTNTRATCMSVSSHYLNSLFFPNLPKIVMCLLNFLNYLMLVHYPANFLRKSRHPSGFLMILFFSNLSHVTGCHIYQVRFELFFHPLL